MDSPAFMDAIEDVHTRFLLNLPASELSTPDRILFQIEQAWWFYEDFLVDPHPELQLPRFNVFKKFAQYMFEYSPLLEKSQFSKYWTAFGHYKRKISNYGCLLLSNDYQKMVLCKLYQSNTFTLPAGKINQHEDGADAAIRETYEETGFDVSATCGVAATYTANQQSWKTTVDESDSLVHVDSGGKRRTMYVVYGVPQDFPFLPVCRKEVDHIGWYPLNDLPKPNFAVTPFIGPLKKWIKKHKKQNNRGKSAPRGNTNTNQSTTPQRDTKSKSPKRTKSNKSPKRENDTKSQSPKLDDNTDKTVKRVNNKSQSPKRDTKMAKTNQTPKDQINQQQTTVAPPKPPPPVVAAPNTTAVQPAVATNNNKKPAANKKPAVQTRVSLLQNSGMPTRPKNRRSAVDVDPSEQRHIDLLKQTICDYEQRLQTSGDDDNQINQYRMLLCEKLSDLCLRSPYETQSMDGLGKLWRLCFYHRIGPSRTRIATLKRKKKPTQTYEDDLRQFLAEGITLYEYLIDNMSHKLVQPVVAGDGDEVMTNDDNATDARTSSIVSCLYKLYIHTGDLYRYAGHSRKAEHQYKIASALYPIFGHAYNQLAVISNQDSNLFTALYWYARSISSKVPFETASSNLSRLFKSNEITLKSQAASTTSTAVLNNASKLFLSQFVDFCKLCLEQQDNQDQYHNAELELTRRFRELLDSSAFSDGLLCKLVTVLVFCETKNQKQSRSTTIQFTQCLAERFLTISQTKKSYRVLMPVLLCVEYLLLSPDASKADFDKLWKPVVDIFNALQSSKPSIDIAPENNGMDPTDALPEYQAARGFEPFSFLPAQCLDEEGYLRANQVVELLHLDAPQDEATQTTVVSKASSTEETNALKIQRFLSLRPKLAALECVVDHGDGSLEWIDLSTDNDDDNVIMGDGNDDDDAVPMEEDEPPPRAKPVLPVVVPPPPTLPNGKLVYHTGAAGGPALLVPGALLQKQPPPPVVAPGPPPIAPAQPPAASLLDSLLAPKPPPQAVGGALPPPPGFGQSFVSQQPPGLTPSFLAGFSHQGTTATNGPTVGETYGLFGSPMLPPTQNPFTKNVVPIPVQPPSQPYQQQVPQPPGETSLLDSGLLNSLLFDNTTRPGNTKNPFST